ncbi:hypothetical protein AND_006895 [Anopheles darlingi]|uniref:Uncharacterized protein n=1 Tax=Anopheles darlingi TaxID=43151 RepID=W5JEZ1_ANODA|nr:hypothetical protein AND_006895 [Anopheles darlingi]
MEVRDLNIKMFFDGLYTIFRMNSALAVLLLCVLMMLLIQFPFPPPPCPMGMQRDHRDMCRKVYDWTASSEFETVSA